MRGRCSRITRATFSRFSHVFSTRPSGMSSACLQDTVATARHPGLACALFCITPRTHLALCQINNAGAIAAFRHLEKRATASLFDIVTVSSNSKDIQGCVGDGFRQSRVPCSTATFSRMIKRWAAISLSLGRTRSTCSSVSTNVTMIGNFPPTSAR